MNKVVKNESKRLEELEKQIENGIGAVGRGLLEIQKDRLYRLNNETFSGYCKDRWGFSESRVYQLIDAEKTRARISTMVEVLPTNERQLREISKIPEKKQAKIVSQVMAACEEKGREPTAKDYKKAAAPFVGSTPPAPSAITTTEVYEDVPGDVEPDDTPEWLSNKTDVDGLRRKVNELTKAIKDAPKLPGFEMVNGLSNRIRLDLLNIKSAIVGCIPFNTCPYCHGNDSECDGCSGRGWVNKHGFENAPKELQDEITSLSSGSSN